MADLVTPIVDGQAIKTETSTTKKSESDVAGGELGKDAFLQLLVTQMQNQDPLEPTSNSDYIAQLATYSQVEELQNIGSAMQSMQAMNMVGKMVDLTTVLSNGDKKTISGIVDYVNVNNGKAYVSVNDSLYEAENVTAIYSSNYTKTEDTTKTEDIKETSKA